MQRNGDASVVEHKPGLLHPVVWMWFGLHGSHARNLDTVLTYGRPFKRWGLVGDNWTTGSLSTLY